MPNPKPQEWAAIKANVQRNLRTANDVTSRLIRDMAQGMDDARKALDSLNDTLGQMMSTVSQFREMVEKLELVQDAEAQDEE